MRFLLRPPAPSSALDRLTSGIGGDAVWLLARCCIGGIFVYSGFGKLTGLEGSRLRWPRMACRWRT
jgi:hypothetical protein